MQQLTLVDGHACLHQAYHATASAEMRNERGQPTGAVYGFMRQMLKLQEMLQPSHFAVMMDEDLDKLLRRQELAGYKSDRRGKCSDELKEQFPMAREALEAFGIPWKSKAGYEADDLIATYARVASPKSDVRIVSHDKDLLQLVDDRIHVINSRTDGTRIMDPKHVRDRWGVDPEQMGDLLALSGDSSDSIPGVPGIGYRKAAALLQRYRDLSGVLRSARDGIIQVPGIGPKLQQNLRDFAQQAEKMREIVELQRVPGMDEDQWETDFELAKRNVKWLDHATNWCNRQGMSWLEKHLREEHEEAMQAVASERFSETGAAPRLLAVNTGAPGKKRRLRAERPDVAGAASAARPGACGAAGGRAAAEAEAGGAVVEPAVGAAARRAAGADAAAEVDTSTPRKKRNRTAWNEFVSRRMDEAKAELLKSSTKVTAASVTKLLGQWWADLKRSDSPEAKEEVERMRQLARDGAEPHEPLAPG